MYHVFFFFSKLPRPPSSTLFPYTTLFRSRRARSETGQESRAMHVLCSARDILDWQPLEHEGRPRRAQDRELLRPLDRYRRGFTQHARITQPLEKALRRRGKEIDFSCPLRLREEFSLCH